MGKKGKKASKNGDKNVTQASEVDQVTNVSATGEGNDTGISQKLDMLLEAVKSMGDQLKQQDERLRRQEEKMSIHYVSAVPSAQSSPKHC